MLTSVHTMSIEKFCLKCYIIFLSHISAKLKIIHLLFAVSRIFWSIHRAIGMLPDKNFGVIFITACFANSTIFFVWLVSCWWVLCTIIDWRFPLKN